MRIVIVGCGKVGTSIASQLNAEGHDIVVVDIDRNAVQNLSNSLDVMGIEGNGASYEVLAEAGAFPNSSASSSVDISSTSFVNSSCMPSIFT